MALLIATPAWGWQCQAAVLRVHDGDTLTVRCEGRGPQKIRIANIDAPELHQSFGPASKQALETTVSGQAILVDAQAVDRYQRVVARIVVGSTDLGLALVAQGGAWCGLRPTAACKRAQADARQARIGLWAEPDPLPPWRWRRAHPRRD